ncbi:hypothetical protein AMTR_s00040p00232780 [Amborella trichopoda]|uniref:Retrotransposon gag domain-containing protein n=1 Tax=Amborella trichopoda TaxID=13333 RepID=W1PZ06_AMBTC|nr:hypothetical protein AMTR_s00040p00232780 [Amborella trichopoda]
MKGPRCILPPCTSQTLLHSDSVEGTLISSGGIAPSIHGTTLSHKSRGNSTPRMWSTWNLKRSIRDYVKEFSTLMLEIPDMVEKDLFFNFMDGLQLWAEQELQQRRVQDLASAMAVAEQLVEFRQYNSSSNDPLEMTTTTVGETRTRLSAPKVDMASPQGGEATRKGLTSPQDGRVARKAMLTSIDKA